MSTDTAESVRAEKEAKAQAKADKIKAANEAKEANAKAKQAAKEQAAAERAAAKAAKAAEPKPERGPTPKQLEKAAERTRLEKMMGVEPGTCLCGCGGHPKKGLFMPGHDARLKSALRRDAAGEDKRAQAAAQKRLEAFGWE